MDKAMHSDVADDILLKHFNLAKVKYPDESWKNFDDVVIEREFVTAAMIEFAEQENQSLRSELQKLQNDLDDALDVKNGSGPTALSRLSNELQKQKELNAELQSELNAANELLEIRSEQIVNAGNKALQQAIEIIPFKWNGYATLSDVIGTLESLIKKSKES